MGRQVPGGRRQRRSGPRSRKVSLVEEDLTAAMKPSQFAAIVARHDCTAANQILLRRNGTLSRQLMVINRSTSTQPVGQNFQSRARNEFGGQEPSQVLGDHQVPPPAETTITPEIAHLLRVYENSIATWMDVFDANLTYQRRLLCMAPSSPLLLNTICALAARQLSLITCPRTWTPVAEHYYSLAVHLLARLLNAYPREMDLAIVATILLSSYELLASTGVDYQRHFKGAHTIVESLNAQRSESRLIRASFWIYARHEIAQALNRNSPTLHDPRSWPKANLTEGEMDEDAFCNDVLRLAAETVCVAFVGGGWEADAAEEAGSVGSPGGTE